MSRPNVPQASPRASASRRARVAGLRILENVAEDMRAPTARPVWRMMRTVYLDQLSRRSASIRIGRSPVCDIRIPHPTVSEHHCRLVRVGTNGLAIEDCGSSNGVYLTAHGPYNPRRVEWGEVRLGCYVYLGDVALVPVDAHGGASLAGGHLSEYVRNARATYGSESQVQRHLGLTETLLQRLSRFWRNPTGNENREG